jgi:RimJ/RimL family protein N-acetyltransferase
MSLCILRAKTLKDLPRFLEAAACPQIQRWLGWGEITEDVYKEIVQNNNPNNYVIADPNTDILLGGCELHQRKRHPNEWTIQYWLHPHSRRKGIALQACQQLLEIGFRKLEAKTIVAYHAPQNQRSETLLKKLGFEIRKQDKTEIERILHISKLCTN